MYIYIYIYFLTYINLCKVYCFIIREATLVQGKAIFHDGTCKFETETQAMTSARSFFCLGEYSHRLLTYLSAQKQFNLLRLFALFC